MCSKPKHKSGAQKRKDKREQGDVTAKLTKYLHRGQSQPCYATAQHQQDPVSLS